MASKTYFEEEFFGPIYRKTFFLLKKEFPFSELYSPECFRRQVCEITSSLIANGVVSFDPEWYEYNTLCMAVFVSNFADFFWQMPNATTGEIVNMIINDL